MAETSSIVFKPSIRDVKGRFAKATAKLFEHQRKAVRVLARRWVEIARMEAPSKTGKFRKSIKYRELIKGKTQVGFETESKQPLGRFIVFGTRPHKIRARRKKALYFFWGKIGKFTVVPKRGGFATHVADNKLWIGKGYVQHPGTKANPYTERAYVRWIKEMEKQILAVADKYIIDLAGRA